MLSMTGYGKGEWKSEEFDLTIELKTVNNRYLDISIKSPKLFLPYEDLIRSTVKKSMTRGHMDLFVSFTDRRKGQKKLLVNLEAARAYLDAAKSLSEQFPDLVNDVTVYSLMKNPDILSEEEGDAENGDLPAVLEQTLTNALASLNDMRKREGEKLKADLLARMDTIEGLVERIKERAPLVAEAYQNKLSERIKAYLEDVKPDEGRLLTEVAVFTDKCNIDEEITRLFSHISQFRTIAESALVGRKLDFLVQEFNRETNTICSKSNDLIVTECGLSLKNEIEKVREQVQNLE